MPIFYPDILEQKTPARTFAYTDKDVMLYALGIGMGRDPMNEKELAFVYERGLKVVPTAATVLMSGGGRPSFQAPAVEPQKPREGFRHPDVGRRVQLRDQPAGHVVERRRDPTIGGRPEQLVG